jgi:hypothetical protein
LLQRRRISARLARFALRSVWHIEHRLHLIWLKLAAALWCSKAGRIAGQSGSALARHGPGMLSSDRKKLGQRGNRPRRGCGTGVPAASTWNDMTRLCLGHRFG